MSAGAIRPFSDNAVKIFDSQSVGASQNISSDAYDVSDLEGNYAAQWSVSASGSAKIELLLSLNGTDYAKSIQLAGAFTAASGTAASGQEVATVTDYFAFKRAKVKVSEVGKSKDVTISLWLSGR